MASHVRIWESTLAPSRCSTPTGTSGAIRSTTAGTPNTATSSAETTAARLQPTTLTRVRGATAPNCRMMPTRAVKAAASSPSWISSRAGAGLVARPSRSTPSGAA